jgi:hypothetical protein
MHTDMRARAHKHTHTHTHKEAVFFFKFHSLIVKSEKMKCQQVLHRVAAGCQHLSSPQQISGVQRLFNDAVTNPDVIYSHDSMNDA